MVKYFKYLALGVFFGVILIKSEVASWFRIQEMFRFQAFHMYGVIGSAIAVGAFSVWIIRHWQVRTISNEEIEIRPSEKPQYRHILGGLIFGFGWALTGACPGPIYALIGYGYPAMIVVLASAMAGAYAYGVLSSKLP